MRRALLLSATLTLLVAGASRAITASATSRAGDAAQPRVAQVMVHCPNNGNDAFVTPPRIRISVGEGIEWRMTGQVASDTLEISLKDGDQAWPFEGVPARGRQVARAANASAPGTYGYNVRLLCRIPNQGVQEVIIDPDIIIVP